MPWKCCTVNYEGLHRTIETNGQVLYEVHMVPTRCFVHLTLLMSFNLLRPRYANEFVENHSPVESISAVECATLMMRPAMQLQSARSSWRRATNSAGVLHNMPLVVRLVNSTFLFGDPAPQRPGRLNFFVCLASWAVSSDLSTWRFEMVPHSRNHHWNQQWSSKDV